MQEMEKEEFNERLKMSYAAVSQEDGTEFKVSSLKAIRAATHRYLGCLRTTSHGPATKRWSVVLEFPRLQKHTRKHDEKHVNICQDSSSSN